MHLISFPYITETSTRRDCVCTGTCTKHTLTDFTETSMNILVRLKFKSLQFFSNDSNLNLNYETQRMMLFPKDLIIP